MVLPYNPLFLSQTLGFGCSRYILLSVIGTYTKQNKGWDRRQRLLIVLLGWWVQSDKTLIFQKDRFEKDGSLVQSTIIRFWCGKKKVSEAKVPNHHDNWWSLIVGIVRGKKEKKLVAAWTVKGQKPPRFNLYIYIYTQNLSRHAKHLQ